MRKAEMKHPCMHDNCSQCCGTGIKVDGLACVHMISCPCPQCSPMNCVPFKKVGNIRVRFKDAVPMKPRTLERTNAE